MKSVVQYLTRGKTLSGDGLMARVVRSSAIVLFGYGASQGLRLISNLILTRLLFPEAFGLMALVAMIEMGLNLFTDMGIAPSVAQSKRGDDPAFLDTAYSLKVIRGVALWLAACLLAYPASLFFQAPELALYLPISAFSMVITGLFTTRVETAFRHLKFGALTLVELASQVISLVFMIVLAWVIRDVLALVMGGIVFATAHLFLARRYLDGHRNQLGWDRKAAHELIHFGKWIFVSTLFNFFASQGDKLVFGRFLSLYVLGIYNIGYYLGSFPMLLGGELVSRVMIPIYREVAEAGSAASARKLRLMRYLMTGGLIALMALFAYVGPLLVNLLYDDRYIHAGAMLVLISLAMMPAAVGLSYDRAALAAGDSRDFFVVSAVRGTTGVLFLLIGVSVGGIVGAIAGMAVSGLAVHPFLIWLSVRHKVWDPLHDIVFAVVIVVLAAGAITLHLDEIREMSVAAAAR